jgi:hypothetical protein
MLGRFKYLLYLSKEPRYKANENKQTLLNEAKKLLGDSMEKDKYEGWFWSSYTKKFYRWNEFIKIEKEYGIKEKSA